VESLAANLAAIPADKRDWKPTPESKSALIVTGEAIGVMRMMLPLFSGGDFAMDPYPEPKDLDDAAAQLAEVGGTFAAALEQAGPALERRIGSPFGEMWAAHAVLWGMIDLIHHHGQVVYIQGLLGDAAHHGDTTAATRWFGPEPGA
jgi:hypothetical protein